MKTEAQKIAERVPLPETLDAHETDLLRAYGLVVAEEAIRGAESSANANVRRLAKVVIDAHLTMDRSGVIGRDGALHCEHCGAMRDTSDGGTDEPHRPNCVVLIAESILATPPRASVEVTDCWRTLDRPLIDVLYMHGDYPFVVAAHGRVGAEALSDIETDLKENPLPEFQEYGEGVFTLECVHESGQYDEMGRCEFPHGWTIGFVSFTALTAALEPEA